MMSKQAGIPAWMQTSSKALPVSAPQWLLDERKKQWQLFCEQGLPTRKHERWKYANLSHLNSQQFNPVSQPATEELEAFIEKHALPADHSHLIVLVDGEFSEKYSRLNAMPDKVIVTSIISALEKQEDLVKSYLLASDNQAFKQANTALFDKGLFLYLPKSCEIKKPIQLLSISLANQVSASHPRNIILLEERSSLNLVEEYCSLGDAACYQNTSLSVSVGQYARLHYYKIQNENEHSTHIANTDISQLQESQVSISYYAKGARFARDNIQVDFLGVGAVCQSQGFYTLKNDKQYIDYHLDFNHLAANTKSSMLYKGVLDKTSSAVFNGRVHVQKGAQKITAHQANHHILLSKTAEAYSKPELEIYADDVKCQHGATTGQLDQEALFFMRSRGISKEQAMAILLKGFANDVLRLIPCNTIKNHVQMQLNLGDGT